LLLLLLLAVGQSFLVQQTQVGVVPSFMKKEKTQENNTREQHKNNIATTREREWRGLDNAFVKRFFSQGGAVNETTATNEPSSSSPSSPSLLPFSLLS
jgi:hypothetical protein